MYSPGSDGEAFNIAACQPSRSEFEVGALDVGDAAGVERPTPGVGMPDEGVSPAGPSVASGALAPPRMPPLLSPPQAANASDARTSTATNAIDFNRGPLSCSASGRRDARRCAWRRKARGPAPSSGT